MTLIAHSKRRLLIDVSHINQVDYRSGIQRVVRNISKTLHYLQSGTNYDVLLVTLHGEGLAYAENANLALFQHGQHTGLVDIQDRDTLLMLDSSWNLIDYFTPVFKAIKQCNGKIITVVYDTIPLDYPQYCASDTLQVFGRWLMISHQYTDYYLCISKDVAARVKGIIDINHWRFRDLSIGYFYLGSELEVVFDHPPHAAATQAADIYHLPYNPELPLFVVVSTLEPRKGHSTVLDAFEQLWQQGEAIQLCFIGKQGWYMDAFCERIKAHPELNKRFFWGIEVDDQALLQTYQMATGLLFASVIEGYGLGIVEAARHHVPVICSDIAVFREIAQDGAVFVEQANPSAWAHAIKTLLNQPSCADSSKIKTITWQESALQVLDFINEPLGKQMVYCAP